MEKLNRGPGRASHSGGGKGIMASLAVLGAGLQRPLSPGWQLMWRVPTFPRYVSSLVLITPLDGGWLLHCIDYQGVESAKLVTTVSSGNSKSVLDRVFLLIFLMVFLATSRYPYISHTLHIVLLYTHVYNRFITIFHGFILNHWRYYPEGRLRLRLTDIIENIFFYYHFL